MKEEVDLIVQREVLETVFNGLRNLMLGGCVQNMASKEELLHNIEFERNKINKLYDDAKLIVEKYF